MNLNELKVIVDAQVDAGNGTMPVAFGDCNRMHMVLAASTGFVRDLDEYYLEETHPDDKEEGDEDNIFIIGE